MRARFLSAVTMEVLLLCGCGDKGTEGEKELNERSVSGTVVRVQTSVPVVNARVILGQDSTVTDSGGKYFFAEILEGVYPLSVVRDSFGYYHDNITIKRDLIYNVPLVPAVRMYGKVYDHLMQPLEGAIVDVDSTADSPAADGIYRIENAATGYRVVTCTHTER